ncbi:MAG: hypothetical protein ACD_24C00543G0001 [uncultured bacterium]|nr:MAG: hypothetical protein ACD_24C00543G0001 [uncultured bacterium]
MASYGSFPAIIFNTKAASATVFVIGPGESVEDAIAINPYLLTLPYVGFNPVIPDHEAGHLMLPPVSDPIAKIHMLAETAAADPPEEPPGTLSVSQGLCVVKKSEVSVDAPCAKASILVLPKITAPASSNLLVTVDS